MPEKHKPKHDATIADADARRMTAEYIADFVRQLELLAHRADIEPLRRVLATAKDEADRAARTA